MHEPDHPSGAAPTPEPAGAGRRLGLLELTRSECLALLAQTTFGRVVVSTAASRTPIIRPVNYVFDGPSQSVVFRTVTGSKFHAIVHSANACFEIDAIDPVRRSGWSVIIVGVTEEVTRPTEIQRLERLDLESWIPHAKPHWIRIRAWTVSGRRVEAPGDDSMRISP